jgi:hypothetical protein
LPPLFPVYVNLKWPPIFHAYLYQSVWFSWYTFHYLCPFFVNTTIKGESLSYMLPLAWTLKKFRKGTISYIIQIFKYYEYLVDHAMAQWLRHCATNRKVAGSIPDGVIWIFH